MKFEDYKCTMFFKVQAPEKKERPFVTNIFGVFYNE